MCPIVADRFTISHPQLANVRNPQRRRRDLAERDLPHRSDMVSATISAAPVWRSYHPGGGVMGMRGQNAAREVLRIGEGLSHSTSGARRSYHDYH